ncbi:MAG: NAD(P)-dependent glycerol-3-phosphate dehydrogenase [Elusimicrobia bacterium]|nr:NAD(P)-dependent glycerol-3-phosphate dehydrogenase [Candidatus Liberimonas magnetica]
MPHKIAVLGAGAWGITLSSLLGEKGNAVTLWEFDPEQAKLLNEKRCLEFCSFAKIPENVNISSDLGQACEQKDFLVLALPSHVLRKVVQKISSFNLDLSKTILVSATKGIEEQSLMRMSEITKLELHQIANRIAVLSGPTIAKEVAEKMPTAVTIASEDTGVASTCQEVFMTNYFRVYTHSDVAGVEAGGSLKNVFAIASGICDGLNFGDNTKAALITRGLREMILLGTKIGGQPSTFFGLAGMGDLIVTCLSKHSRNRQLGEMVGKGLTAEKAQKDIIMIAEGVKTSRSAYQIGSKLKIELPIIEQVFQVLYCNKPPKLAVEELMLRGPKPEKSMEVGQIII